MSRFSDYLTFVALVETGSMTEAARKLHRSVSAISKQLAKLEERLSVQLIIRSTQSLSVTGPGEKFYLSCKEILAAVDRAEQSLTDELSVPSGRVTLSIPEVLLRTGFMDLLGAFIRAYPLITLDLKISNTYVDIIDEKVDFAFRMGELSDSRLTAITLMSSEPIFCAAPDYIRHRGKPTTYAELVTEHRLILPSYLNLSDQVRRFFSHTDKLPFSIENAHCSNSEAALYESVLRGLGISVMLDFSVSEDIKKGRLIKLLPETSFPPLKLSLLYKNSDFLPEKVRVFKGFVSTCFAQYVNELKRSD